MIKNFYFFYTVECSNVDLIHSFSTLAQSYGRKFDVAEELGQICFYSHNLIVMEITAYAAVNYGRTFLQVEVRLRYWTGYWLNVLRSDFTKVTLHRHQTITLYMHRILIIPFR